MNAGVYDSNRANSACAADNSGLAGTWMTAITCLMLACFLVSCGKRAEQPSAPQAAKDEAIVRNSAMVAPKESAPAITAAPETEGPAAQRAAAPGITNDQAPFSKLPASPTLAEQLKAYQAAKRGPASAEQRNILARLKHAVATDSPELDVPEIQRDAAVSGKRLSEQHAGKLYKFFGLILEIGLHDVRLVIKNTEIVCSFADSSWEDEGLKVGNYLYACGCFQSYKEAGDLKQISMANCYVIEDYTKLRTTPITAEENQQLWKNWEADVLYKMRRDLGGQKTLRSP